jgi:D-amino-acid dehydrogenase
VSLTDYERKIVYARLGQQLRVAAMVDIVGYDETVDAGRLRSMRRLAGRRCPGLRLWPGGGVGGDAPATPTGVPIIGATAYATCG